MMALPLSHSPRAWHGVEGRKAQPDTNTRKGKRLQGGWIEGKVGNEAMGSSRIHPRGIWQDSSCSWSTGPGDVQDAELQQMRKVRLWQGEKRREHRGERLEGAKHHRCHGFAKSWRDKAGTWGLQMTKVTGWTRRSRIWILPQTWPFFMEKKHKKSSLAWKFPKPLWSCWDGRSRF